MPEAPEVRIMSDFINQNSKNKFNKAFHIERGNNPTQFIDSDFNIKSESNGKELLIFIDDLPIHIFMGMSGNWKYVATKIWDETKFTRLRLDDSTNHSLLLYGGFMGPRYSVGKPFTGVKRGPDPTREFEDFKTNIYKNIDNKAFNKPICETLLNQEYFNGIGNYLRSTILYYADVNPFESAKTIIKTNNKVIDLCKNITLKSYQLNGGQLKDWKNPFNVDSKLFEDWVFYKKGLACTDKTGRTFWFDEKWKDNCPYHIKNKNKNEFS
jgi:formamidopyrimidine-DNA glycosylase